METGDRTGSLGKRARSSRDLPGAGRLIRPRQVLRSRYMQACGRVAGQDRLLPVRGPGFLLVHLEGPPLAQLEPEPGSGPSRFAPAFAHLPRRGSLVAARAAGRCG